MAKRSRTHHVTLRQEALKSGWSLGRSLLTIPFNKAYRVLQGAGINVYMDEGQLFGPSDEAIKALEVLAEHGDTVSAYALEIARKHASPK